MLVRACGARSYLRRLLTSHSMMVSSSLPEARVRPSGREATQAARAATESVVLDSAELEARDSDRPVARRA